ncbi:ATP-binding protein [Candidatus Neptunochlamydia vexilliferae]|uniref:ATP-binding protein n=1 Tax=Candidatus Neptunichlamydia vexilliferae TaxID=1651774 RepID=UPI0018917685|nr:ATP-binding protein [Candidatus Neptunochlamydia vexilliferae]
MFRYIEKELEEWRKKKEHLPLILRGARQIGKSYIIEKFGKKAFDSVVVIDFEFQPEFCECFETLDPKKILNRLELISEKKIIPEKTLLFLDEIQECPKAIMALRYFKEKMPKLHVIGAGSLLEFVLGEEDFSFPVGRVQFLFMGPLSFSEFLLNTGNERLVEFLGEVEIKEGVPGEVHKKLLEELRLYLALGGMPAVVQKYLKTNSLIECRRVQLSILQAYQNDFGKYASKGEHRHLQLLFEKAPKVVATHFKYVNVSADVKSREIKVALEQLCYAGLLTRVYATAASGFPLSAQIKENRFKILFLDIGLLHTAHRVDINELWQEDLLQIHSGRLAEQFVGQELLNLRDFYESPQLFFWKREQKGSSAEVDYLLTSKSSVIPLEVKAGATGRLRSMHQFMEKKGSPLGVKVSMAPLSRDGNILSVPLYMVDQIHRLVR